MSINIIHCSEARVSASARPSVDLINNTQVPLILGLDHVKLLVQEAHSNKRRYNYVKD